MLYYWIDMVRGQSGGPLHRALSWCKVCAQAINTAENAGNGDYNAGTLINYEVYRNLDSWRRL
jgi:V8-like Glu-specific endopeptidase